MSDYIIIGLLVLGIIFLLIELVIPGFGIFGISGICMIIASCMLTISKYEFGGILVIIEMILLVSALVFGIKKGLFKNSKVVLNENLAQEEKEIYVMSDFDGKTGITASSLRPQGVAKFDGVEYDVTSIDGIISKGADVKVDMIKENKIFVKEV